MNFLNRFIADLQYALEQLDHYRDKVLFIFIKPLWPRFITPNHLTLFRVVIGVLLCVMLFFYRNDSTSSVITLFFIGISTDMLDGSVARALNKETRVGAILDPTADRILILPIAVYSLFSEHRWLLLILLLLEIANGLISIWSQGKNIYIPVNIFAKIKMFLQSLVFLTILIFWPKPPNFFFIYILWISALCMAISMYVKFNNVNKLLKKHGS